MTVQMVLPFLSTVIMVFFTVSVLERYLADFPDQWFAFYDVWESSREPA